MTLNQLIIFTVDFMIIIFAVIFMITHFFKIRYIFQFILCVLVWQFNQHILWLQFNQEYYCYMKCVNGILTKNQTRIACLHLTLSCIFKMLPFIWSSWIFPCMACCCQRGFHKFSGVSNWLRLGSVLLPMKGLFPPAVLWPLPLAITVWCVNLHRSCLFRTSS